MDTFSTKKRSSMIKVLILFIIVASLSLGAYIYQAKEVKITIDHNTTNIKTYAKTVEDLLKEENITLDKDAKINIEIKSELKNDMHIKIVNPKSYIIYSDGKKQEVKSTFNTTGEILDDLNIELNKDDYTIPSLDSKVKYGTEIEIIRVKEEIEEKTETIPFTEITKEKASIDKGSSKVHREGEEGSKKITIKKTFKNNEVVKEEILKEEIVKKPIDKIIFKGTKEKVKKTPKINQKISKEPRIIRNQRTSRNQKTSRNFKTSRNSKPISRKTMIFNATAYDDSAQSQGKWVGTTATGVKPRRGVVAVDPRVIPLGTKLYIESLDGSRDYGYAVAGDTGGAIKGNRIDLFFHSRSEVYNFGRRQVKVHILN